MNPRSAAACPLLALLVCTTAAAQSVLGKVEGSLLDRHLGAAVQRFFDVDGDGWNDYLAGAPAESYQGAPNGVVQVLSGRYLATGVGAPKLLTVDGVSPRFGESLASLGDLDGDGAKDFAVGASDYLYVYPNQSRDGAVLVRNAVNATSYLIQGATGEELGASVALFEDLNGDGVLDLLIGAPGFGTTLPPASFRGQAAIYSGAHLLQDQKIALRKHVGSQASERYGSVVATGEFDGDSFLDYVIATPFGFNAGAAQSGRVTLYSGATGAVLRDLVGAAGSRFGASVAANLDLTGDGVNDVVVGAPGASPNGTESGRVYVYSGANLLSGGLTIPIHVWDGPAAFNHFGAAVAAVDDLNGDGRADIVVGAPDYVLGAFGQQNGLVRFYSGETGELLGQIAGVNNGALGGALGSAFKVDGAPGWELLVGSPRCSVVNPQVGRVSLLSIYPNSPTLFCTGKQNSLGCTSAISSTGTPSATSATPFLVRATNVLNNAPGLLFYGRDANALPFQGGFLCVAPPTTRTAGKLAGGTPPPASDCSGVLSIDFNAYLQSGADPTLVVGQEVFCQVWSRDPQSPSTTNLTNGLRFLVNP